jgi:NitT/TauT family transport system substrate-binding protein
MAVASSAIPDADTVRRAAPAGLPPQEPRMTHQSRRAILSGGLAASALLAAPAIVKAATPVRFTLDFKNQGIHSWYYLARERGYFRDAGLDVVIDQGEGSAATITRIMSGAYDAGFGDINAIIQQAANRPGEQPIMVYQIYNRPPFVVVTKASGPIRTVKDMEGKTLGGPAGSATLRLFPSFAKANGIDPAKVTLSNMAPNLQEQMLIQGQVDGTLSFNVTSYMNLLQQRLDPEKDFRWFNFGDHGLNLYSNGIMVSPKMVKDQPQAVAGLVSAINRSIKDVAADRAAGMAVLTKVEPLLNADIENRRIGFAFANLMNAPEVADIGIGDLVDSRLAQSIAVIVDAYQLPRTPSPGDVFNRSFLPPKADRTFDIKA